MAAHLADAHSLQEIARAAALCKRCKHRSGLGHAHSANERSSAEACMLGWSCVGPACRRHDRGTAESHTSQQTHPSATHPSCAPSLGGLRGVLVNVGICGRDV